jgi:hypothetical protein
MAAVATMPRRITTPPTTWTPIWLSFTAGSQASSDRTSSRMSQSDLMVAILLASSNQRSMARALKDPPGAQTVRRARPCGQDLHGGADAFETNRIRRGIVKMPTSCWASVCGTRALPDAGGT